MLEIPESCVIAQQLDRTITGKTIQTVQANSSPHGFAFYFGDPNHYPDLLNGKTIEGARAVAGQVEIAAQDARILLGDGTNIRYLSPQDKIPPKHQLYLGFDDGSSIVCTVQMYGGLWAFLNGQNDNPYYLVALEKPSPLSDDFSESYFEALFGGLKPNLSTKALLATEQRIPGLGNGTLQDILFTAKINPRTKIESLSRDDKMRIYHSIRQTLQQMVDQGGRDTEKDLFGRSGGYKTILSNKTLQHPCPVCGDTIVRQAYLGGNVYFCPTCQPLDK